MYDPYRKSNAKLQVALWLRKHGFQVFEDCASKEALIDLVIRVPRTGALVPIAVTDARDRKPITTEHRKNNVHQFVVDVDTGAVTY